MNSTKQYSETHHIVLVKLGERTLRSMDKNLTAMISAVNNRSLANRGWLLEAESQAEEMLGQAWRSVDPDEADLEEMPEANYRYEMYMTLTWEREDGKKPDKHEAAAIYRTLATKAQQYIYGQWRIASVDEKPYTMPGEDEGVGTTDDLMGYVDVAMPEDEEWHEYFAHLYGLDSHVGRVKAALDAAVNSGWQDRFHVTLVGPPGCGKSDICESVRQALGEDAVVKLDATATTQQGAIKLLAEREILPRVIIIEEIEKAPEAAMLFLLGVLDSRGEIRKVTARQEIQRQTRLFAICTVNDYAAFKKLQAGALHSRFSNKVFFKRPSRDTLNLILQREVARVNGDIRWIEPALDYCEEAGVTDPRQVISICLCGRDGLLDKSYQKMMAETAEPQDED